MVLGLRGASQSSESLSEHFDEKWLITDEDEFEDATSENVQPGQTLYPGKTKRERIKNSYSWHATVNS